MKKSLLLLLLMVLLPNNILPSMQLLKKFGIGVGIFGTALTGYRQTNLYLKERQYKNLSDDAAVVNPQLNDVFIQIRQDFGIKENVKLRVFKNNSDFFRLIGGEGVYSYYSKSVYLAFVDVLSKPKIIHNIAHELEHHRQYQKYPRSFPFSYVKWINNEQGADAASAGYQNCYDCLREVALGTTYRHEPNNTPYGFFTTLSGYFSPQDYELYAQESQKNNAQCPAHKARIQADIYPTLKDFVPEKY
ncbi:hypothetical protein KBB68_01505 [Candidatus Babeliales bacterium]|nr:hypothetical protein [Candidatus Babeliales bacterium]